MKISELLFPSTQDELGSIKSFFDHGITPPSSVGRVIGEEQAVLELKKEKPKEKPPVVVFPTPASS